MKKLKFESEDRAAFPFASTTAAADSFIHRGLLFLDLLLSFFASDRRLSLVVHLAYENAVMTKVIRLQRPLRVATEPAGFVPCRLAFSTRPRARVVILLVRVLTHRV